MTLKNIIFSLCLYGFVFGQVVHGQWHQKTIDVMGTRASTEFWSSNTEQTTKAFDAVFSTMHHVNARMSPYIESSELSNINRSAFKKPVTVSTELFDLIEYAIKISKMTQAAFDITFASVGYLYQYKNKIKPSDAEINKLKSAIDYRLLELNSNDKTVRFLDQRVKIDLGGIAKGHAVDQAIIKLKQLGIEHAIVKAGGDSRIIGDRRGRPWLVGIAHPRKKPALLSKIPLINVAVSTSGDYERYFMDNNNRFHHIINPETGRSSSNAQSVTIIANDSTFADALSTSVFVLGPHSGLQLINSLKGISAIIVDAEGKLHYSSDLLMAK